MSIQLTHTEDFSEGLKRLIIAECKSTLRYLRKAKNEEEKHEAVHEASEAFRKVRACLRLVRDDRLETYWEIHQEALQSEALPEAEHD